jgi:hypothetical protein
MGNMCATPSQQAWSAVAASIQQAAALGAPVVAAEANAPANAAAPASVGLEGRPLQMWLGSLQLLEQRFTVGAHAPGTMPPATTHKNAQEFRMVAPLDVDAVLDMLLEHGAAVAHGANA